MFQNMYQGHGRDFCATLPAMERPSRALDVSLWIAQALLALAFGMAGAMKATQPIDLLAGRMVWPGDVPPGLVRFIGVSEFLGAIGILLPRLLGILPWLTPVAARGLVLVMFLAAAFHVTRSEWIAIPVNVALGAIGAFISWGRSKYD